MKQTLLCCSFYSAFFIAEFIRSLAEILKAGTDYVHIMLAIPVLLNRIWNEAISYWSK